MYVLITVIFNLKKRKHLVCYAKYTLCNEWKAKYANYGTQRLSDNKLNNKTKPHFNFKFNIT